MDVNSSQTATVIATWIAPIVPYMWKGIVTGGKKFVETIGKKIGESTWNQAKKIWQKIEKKYGNDDEFKGIRLAWSKKPDSIAYKKAMIELLAERLSNDVEFLEELVQDFGGKTALQRIIASHGSIIENIYQETDGQSEQYVSATKESTIKGVRQIKN